MQFERNADAQIQASTDTWCAYYNGKNKITLKLAQKNNHVYAALETLNHLINTVIIEEHGLMLLHASAVAISEKLFIFIGKSGTGKSTLAACLTTLGAELVSDDKIILEKKESLPMVCSGIERQLINALIGTTRLITMCGSSDTMEKLLTLYPKEINSDLKSNYKIWVQVNESKSVGLLPTPLHAVLFPIVVDSHIDKFTLSRLSPADALTKLTTLNISDELSPKIKKQIFRHLSSVARKTPCLQVRLRKNNIKDIEYLYEYLKKNL